MQVVAEIIVGRPDPGNAAWIGITAVIVAVAYGVAVAVPNIWPVMVRLLLTCFTCNCLAADTTCTLHSST